MFFGRGQKNAVVSIAKLLEVSSSPGVAEDCGGYESRSVCYDLDCESKLSRTTK